MNISADSPPFVSGPQPRHSLAKHKDALYSGLLECPLTTRLNKTIDNTTAHLPFGQGRGWLTYAETGQKGDVGKSYTYMSNYCAKQPRSDLLAQRNPTCDGRESQRPLHPLRLPPRPQPRPPHPTPTH
eukprot:COSAG04_NODE_11193_length_724_cov_1.521600_1_plen_127_part_10